MSGSAVQDTTSGSAADALPPTAAASAAATGGAVGANGVNVLEENSGRKEEEGGGHKKNKVYKRWDQLTPRERKLRDNFRIWASSFVRLDPRYRIHRFFQGIAQRGELKLQEAVWQKKKRESLLADDPERKARELLASCFNMASVFTIWRPCSEDAIRKMMQGKGVGKGLDIKGKSAKFGRCSGYVPFLQIHNEDDKKKIDLLPRDARMRIFYTSEETRQLAVDTLESVKEEMMETVDIDQDSMTILRWSMADNPVAPSKKPSAITVQNGSDSVSVLGSRESLSMSLVRDRIRGRASDNSSQQQHHEIMNHGSINTFPRHHSLSPSRKALKRIQSVGPTLAGNRSPTNITPPGTPPPPSTTTATATEGIGDDDGGGGGIMPRGDSNGSVDSLRSVGSNQSMNSRSGHSLRSARLRPAKSFGTRGSPTVPTRLRSAKSFGATGNGRDSVSPPRSRRMGLQTIDSFALRKQNGQDTQSMPNSPLLGNRETRKAAPVSLLSDELDDGDDSFSDPNHDSMRGLFMNSTNIPFARSNTTGPGMPRLETIASMGKDISERHNTFRATLPNRRAPLMQQPRESLISSSNDPFDMAKRASLASLSSTGGGDLSSSSGGRDGSGDDALLGSSARSSARESMVSLTNNPLQMITKKDNPLRGGNDGSSSNGSLGSSSESLPRSNSQCSLNSELASIPDDDDDDTENDDGENDKFDIDNTDKDKFENENTGGNGNGNDDDSKGSKGSNASSDIRESLTITGDHGNPTFIKRTYRRSRKDRRHSLSGNPADIAMRRRESNLDAVGGGTGQGGGNPAVNLKTTSVLTNQQCLLQRQDSSVLRETSDVMEYTIASQRRQAWEMEDPSITMINDYTQDGRYGIEVAERLFWEALVIRQENHCQKWHILHPKDKTFNNKNNELYDPGAYSEDKKTTRPPKDSFATKLMKQMIVVSEYDKDNSVIEWIEDDKAWSFVIVNKNRFVNEVLWPIRRRDEEKEKKQDPDSMFPTKYSSFAGELRRCRFVEETTGKGFARFSHKLFRKDRPEISALIGSEHDTGRESSSALQDANFKALRYKPTTSGCAGGHRVVLFNMDDECDPLCPHNLLMAYEEHGRVVPVVSDFDGFLVGTKRINFDQDLPPDQVEILEGSILSAQDILEGKAMGDNWMERWNYASRDYLGQNNSRITGKKRPKMPQFGYGDAKSYRLMEGAVAQLAKQDGAVRHGAECFNYVFPQEIDQTFLIISDSLGGRVRWKYVDSVKLHYFLSNCIDNGYAFPLNPKWVLCDPGWSKLYDQLWQSKIPNVQKALNVWFPPKIREMIQQIQTKHPTGLRFATPGKGPKLENMGLPCIAKYFLRAQKRNGVVPGEDEVVPDEDDSVTLWIDRGSVILFSKPELRTGLVCATNESCVPICGGVTQALTGVGGPELLEDVKALPVEWESSFGPVRCVTGSAKIVSRKGGKNYGNLGVSHVIYAVGPAYGETYSSDNDVGIKDGFLRDAYRKSLQCAKDRGLEAVAFSLLSAGKRSSRWDPQRALRIGVRAIVDYEDYGSLKEIHMCAFTAGEVAALENIAKEFSLTPAAI